MFERLKSHGVNLVALGFALILIVAYFIRHDAGAVPSRHWLWIVSLMMSFFASIFNYWRQLKITEAPISTIAAAAQGYVELYGKAKTDKPLKTPYQDIPCVWYRASVYANRETQDENFDLLNIMPLEYEESKTAFTLDDGTAQCTVNPEGAEVIYFEARTWRKNDHRYVEEYLPADKLLYVIGQLDTRKDVLDDATLNRQLGVKLADWKSRQRQLLIRYDQNLNDQIDMDEWEKVRQAAIAEIKAEYAMHANIDSDNGSDFTLAKPAGKQLFLISAKSPQQLRNSYKTWMLIHLASLAVLAAFYLKLA